MHVDAPGHPRVGHLGGDQGTCRLRGQQQPEPSRLAEPARPRPAGARPRGRPGGARRRRRSRTAPGRPARSARAGPSAPTPPPRVTPCPLPERAGAGDAPGAGRGTARSARPRPGAGDTTGPCRPTPSAVPSPRARGRTTPGRPSRARRSPPPRPPAPAHPAGARAIPGSWAHAPSAGRHDVSMPPDAESVLDTRAPRFREGQVEQVLGTHWGIEPRTLGPLPSDRDLNVLVDERYVLKVSNPAERPDLVDLEDVSLAHVRRVAPDLPVPLQVEARSGRVVTVADASGRACLARLITVVPGTPLEGTPDDPGPRRADGRHGRPHQRRAAGPVPSGRRPRAGLGRTPGTGGPRASGRPGRAR